MKAGVLYSGGKDSSFMAVMLKRLGLDVELCTANFGVYDSYIPASKSAKSLGFKHNVLKMDKEILNTTCDMIMEDGFPNDGIKFIHESVVEEIAEKYPQTYAVWRTNIGKATPEGGETCEELFSRVTEFFKSVLESQDETICLVCHAIPIRMLESYIHCGCVDGAQEIGWVPNASVTVYAYDGAFQEVERGTCDFLGELCTNLPKTI